MTGFRRTVYPILFLLLLSPLFGESPVRIGYTNLSDGSIELYCENDALCPMQVLFRFTEFKGLETVAEMPYYFIAPAGRKTFLFSMNPIPGQTWSFRYDYRSSPGDPVNGKPDTNWVYLLPYRHGTKTKVIQGYHGAVSHSGWQEYSVDFDLPEGTEIYAARDGKVVETKDNSSIGGWDESFAKYGNYILVLHDDGTFGSYYHLKKNGALVKPGDRVQAGQVIGLSGNTGRSNTPHLHFMVYRPYWTSNMTIPSLFDTGKPVPEILQEGRYYYSYHPGGKPFSAFLGEDLTDSQLDSTNFPPEEGQFRVFTDQIDDTVLFFAANGLTNDVTLLVLIDLTNMRYTKEKPYIGTVPANTGKYLFLIRPEDPSKPSRYFFRWKYWNKK